MNEKVLLSRSPGLKLDLTAINRDRNTAQRNFPESPMSFPQNPQFQLNEVSPDSERKTNSASPTHHLNLVHDEKSSENVSSKEGNVVGEVQYDKQSQPQSPVFLYEHKNPRIKLKNQKYFRDLNKSLANLASKRIVGRSASDIDASNYLFLDGYMASRKNRNGYNYSAFHGSKTPVSYTKMSPNKAYQTSVHKKYEHTPKTLYEKRNYSNINPLDSPFERHTHTEQQNSSEQNVLNRNEDVLFGSKSTPKQSQRYPPRGYHHHHNTSLSKFQKRKLSNQSNLANLLHMGKDAVNSYSSNKNPPYSNMMTSAYNVHTEGNTPLYPRYGANNTPGMKDLSRYFNANSLSNLSSIDSAINQQASRFSGMTDEFRVDDLQNQWQIQHSKTTSSNLQNPHKKSGNKFFPAGQTPTNSNTINFRSQPPTPIAHGLYPSATPSFKNQLVSNVHFIYDMHERIARHSKTNMEERLKKKNQGYRSDYLVTENNVAHRRENIQSFQRYFTIEKEEKDQENSFEHEHEPEIEFDTLDKKHVSEGVEYRAGGVGVGSSSGRKERTRDPTRPPLYELDVHDLNSLRQDALQIKQEMAQRKQDYEEFNLFIKSYNREAKRSKRNSMGNSSEKSLMEMNAPFITTLNTKPDRMDVPSTNFSTQPQQQVTVHNRHISNLTQSQKFKPKHLHKPQKSNYSEKRKRISFERGVVFTGDGSRVDLDSQQGIRSEEYQSRGRTHEQFATESNQNMHTEVYTNSSMYRDVKVERGHCQVTLLQVELSNIFVLSSRHVVT